MGLPYQGWPSQNACHNSKQGRPRSDCFFNIFPQKQSDLGLYCLSMPFWQETSVQNDRNTSLPVSMEMWVIRAGILKMPVRIANRGDPDQTASSEAVLSGSAQFVQAFLAGN